MKRITSLFLAMLIILSTIPLSGFTFITTTKQQLLFSSNAYQTISSALESDKATGKLTALSTSYWSFGYLNNGNYTDDYQKAAVGDLKIRYRYGAYATNTVSGVNSYLVSNATMSIAPYDLTSGTVTMVPKYNLDDPNKYPTTIVENGLLLTGTASLNFKSPQEGYIKIHDPLGGKISAVAQVNNFSTGCLSGNNVAYFTIKKNGEKIWPVESDSYKFTLHGSTCIDFPTIETYVEKGDEIVFSFSQTDPNTNVFAMNPQIDFYETVVVEDADNAAAVIKNAIEKDKINGTVSALSTTSWYVKSSKDEIKNLEYYNYYGISDYQTSNGNGWLNTVAKEGHSGINFGYEFVTTFQEDDFANLLNNQGVDVPKSGLLFTVGYGGKKYFSFSYNVPKNGRITIKDPLDGYITSINKIENLTTNSLANSNCTANFAIYKNNEKIWPTNSDYFTFTSSQTYIPFPEINGLYVEEGDTINLVFERTKEQYALSMALNPQIQYELVRGDYNSDGLINILDLVRAKKSLIAEVPEYLSYFDLNNDSAFTALDLVTLRKYLLEVIDNFNGELEPEMTNININPSQCVTVKTSNDTIDYQYGSKGVWTEMTSNPKTVGLEVEKYSQYDISELKNAKINKATLHFIEGDSSKSAINFYSGANGNLYIQSFNTPEKWNDTNFASFYENSQIEETSFNARKLISSSNNFYLYNDSEMEKIDFDVTEYIQKLVDTQNETFDIKYSFYTKEPKDGSFTIRVEDRVVLIVDAYIPQTNEQNDNVSFAQKANYKNTVISSVPTTLDNGFLIEGKVKSYIGSLKTPVMAVPTMRVCSITTGEVLKNSVGSGVWLDGTGKTIRNEINIKGFDLSDIVIDFTVSAGDKIFYYKKIEPMDSIQGVYPQKIYTVTDDSAMSRNYSLPIYVDYLYNFDTDIMFGKSGDLSDHFNITNVNISEFLSGKNSIEKNVVLPLYSEKYTISSKVVTQRATLSSKKIEQPIRLLCLGDSVTDGYGSTTAYYQYTQELFYKEAIDFNDQSRNIMTLGTNVKGVSPKVNTFSYNGITHTIKSFSEGRGGWTLSNFLYHPTQILYKQDFLDAGGDLTDIINPLSYIHSTSKISSTAQEPANVFFDNDKNGNIKFSIKKWLERYRTHDENGNKLLLGNGTGSCITENNIDSYTVCEPTHVLLQFGHNDMRIYPEEQFRKNINEMISAIKSELPDAVIIISMTPPSLGTYNKELYNNYPGSTPTGEQWFYNAQYLNEYFKDYDEEANKVYLLPTYFVTPTADAYNNDCVSPELHPNENAHFNWGYQLYSLLKYIG